MMNFRYSIYLLLHLVFLYSCANKAKEAPQSGSVIGQLDHYEAFESDFVRSRNVDVWTPTGYTPEKDYAVLYMHDGQMLFDTTHTWNHQEWGLDEAMDSLIKQRKIIPCIVVGVSNAGAGRHGDYFPEKAFNHIPNDYLLKLRSDHSSESDTTAFPFQVNSDNYLKFIVHELKPFIDSAYSTLSSQKYTFVGGSSMGGLISMYAICEYPEIFGGAACLSTHWIGTMEQEFNPIPVAFTNYMDSALPSSINHKFYFDFGTETLDAYYEPHQIRIDSVMIENGYSDKNWQTLKFEGQDHSEQSWRSRLSIPLEFLLNSKN